METLLLGVVVVVAAAGGWLGVAVGVVIGTKPPSPIATPNAAIVSAL